MKYIRCGLCKRLLKNVKSQQIGYGATCYKKYMKRFDNKQPALFDITHDNNYNLKTFHKSR